jgi:hypothetical protein
LADIDLSGGIRCDQIAAPCLIDEPINDTSFRADARAKDAWKRKPYAR